MQKEFASHDAIVLQKYTLQWRHNGHDSVSNHHPHDCLLNRLFRRRWKKTSKLCVTGLCVGNSPVTGEFPAQMASNAENVSIRVSSPCGRAQLTSGMNWSCFQIKRSKVKVLREQIHKFHRFASRFIWLNSIQSPATDRNTLYIAHNCSRMFPLTKSDQRFYYHCVRPQNLKCTHWILWKPPRPTSSFATTISWKWHFRISIRLFVYAWFIINWRYIWYNKTAKIANAFLFRQGRVIYIVN